MGSEVAIKFRLFLMSSTSMNINNGDKFLKKLWCCVGGWCCIIIIWFSKLLILCWKLVKGRYILSHQMIKPIYIGWKFNSSEGTPLNLSLQNEGTPLSNLEQKMWPVHLSHTTPLRKRLEELTDIIDYFGGWTIWE